MERERLGEYASAAAIAIPHGKLKNLDDLVLGFGLSHKGVDFESMHGCRWTPFFLRLHPAKNLHGLHLKYWQGYRKYSKTALERNKLTIFNGIMKMRMYSLRPNRDDK